MVVETSIRSRSAASLNYYPPVAGKHGRIAVHRAGIVALVDLQTWSFPRRRIFGNRDARSRSTGVPRQPGRSDGIREVNQSRAQLEARNASSFPTRFPRVLQFEQ